MAQAFLERIWDIDPDYRSARRLMEHVTTEWMKQTPRTQIGKDGKEMMLVPPGVFEMGGNESQEEKPPHQVYSRAFYMDRYPVTNAEYKRFVDATKHAPPSHWNWGRIPAGKEQHPVVHVSWEDASKYAAWADKRLPTEAEWEKAARGTDGRIYPWGNDADPAKYYLITHNQNSKPVGSYPSGASPYGALDMSGGVSEWVFDWYGSTYYQESLLSNPQGPVNGDWHVLRGGSWLGYVDLVRSAFRFWSNPSYTSLSNSGFRCARGTSP